MDSRADPFSPESLPIDPAQPLVIVDVDEVLAMFMAGFEAFVGRHGLEMRVDKFALFQNIYRPGELKHIDVPSGLKLFEDFFRQEHHEIEPVPGAAEALRGLAARAQVVILTNAPDYARLGRGNWLRRHGMDYPMLINSGLKGAPVAALTARSSAKAAFVDDLLPNLESVAEAAPAVSTFQMVADERLRALSPAIPERHPRIDDWPSLKDAIETAIL